jgi:hypothetical protein
MYAMWFIGKGWQKSDQGIMFWLSGLIRNIMPALSCLYFAPSYKAKISCSFFQKVGSVSSSEIITISSLLSSAGTCCRASLSASSCAFLGSAFLVFRVIAVGALSWGIGDSAHNVAQVVKLFVLHYGGFHVLGEDALGAALFGVVCAGGDEADHE